MAEEKKMQALDDEALDTVVGGRGVVIGTPLGRQCEKCGIQLYTTSKYCMVKLGSKTLYYCDEHAPKDAKAPAKSC
jgi:hypothetical protein